MKKFGFNYKGRKFEIEVEECKSFFSKFRGLMFRKKSLPLLFYFNGLGLWAIHSFFCKPFFAIWFDGEKVVDGKLVKPWKFFVKPKEKFNKLLEIPSNDKNFLLLSTEESFK